MDRVVFLIDGFNLYHSLKAELRYRAYRWLDLRKLCSMFIKHKSQTLEEIYYFTALAEWNSAKVKRHKQYLKALRTTEI
jgi:uncharacterized LabA/DUF88 family protein